MGKQSKKSNGFVTFLKVLLIVLLVLGIAGLVIMLVRSSEDYPVDETTGMYIEYGDSTITSENGGVSISYSETETAVFTIGNTEDWGIYDVTSCTVKVVNNVSSTSNYDFEYIVDGANLPSAFSDITDFTSVFATDGNAITVNEDGTFELNISYKSMSDILQAYYGKTVTISSDVSLSSYAYFAIQITSPDEETVITIPIILAYTSVTDLTISPNGIYF